MATVTPSPDPQGWLSIERHLPVPHPQAGPVHSFRVLLPGGADWVQIRVYSPAHTLEASARLGGAFGPGWNQAAFSFPDLVGGLHYYVLEAGRGPATVRSTPGRLYIVR